MSKISFEKVIREAKFLSPLRDFKPVVQKIEFRKDPLTGRWCRINMERARRVKQATTGGENLSEIVEKSKKSCFFCPRNLDKATPMFPSNFPSGRLKRGSAVLFPNLFPFSEFHAVGILSREHFLNFSDFSRRQLFDCFWLCINYLKLVRKAHRDVKYCTLNWNWLPPAAASIIHPHVQVTADRKPTSYVREILQASRRYFQSRGSNYWLDLIESERNGDRWIGERDSVSWMTSFAPQGNREVLGVFSDGSSSLLELSNSSLRDFCTGILRILKGYREMGVDSFNLTFFSASADGEAKDWYSLHSKIISRPNFRAFYASDDGFMEKFHEEPIIETKPEDVASFLRRYF